MLVGEISNETVRVIVIPMVEWGEGTEVRPITIPLVSHVISNSGDRISYRVDANTTSLVI